MDIKIREILSTYRPQIWDSLLSKEKIIPRTDDVNIKEFWCESDAGNLQTRKRKCNEGIQRNVTRVDPLYDKNVICSRD